MALNPQSVPWWRRYFILIAALPLVVGTLTPLGTASWYRYVIIATLIFVTGVLVLSLAAKRSIVMRVGAALLGLVFVGFVWVAQQSRIGSEILLVLAAAIGVSLISWFVRYRRLRA